MKKILIIAAIVAAWFWFKKMKTEAIANGENTLFGSSWLLTSSAFPSAASTTSTSSTSSTSSSSSSDSSSSTSDSSTSNSDGSGSVNPGSRHPADITAGGAAYFTNTVKPKSCFR